MIFSSLSHLLKLSVFGKVARYLGNYALSWILFPEDFGILAIAIAYSQVILILRSSGLQAYFIQNYETEKKRLFSTVFFADLVVASILAVLIAGVGQILISQGLIEASIRDIMALMGLNLLISGLSNIYFFDLKKRLAFKSYSNTTIVADVISTISKILAALSGFGAVSFIFGEIFGSLFKVIYSYKFIRRNVRLVDYDSSLNRQIFWYIKHSLLISAATYAISNFDKLLLYRMADLSDLGKYTFAYSQVMMLYMFFVAPINNLLMSLLPKFYGQPNRLNEVTQAMQVLATALFVPFFAFLFFNADLLLSSIYSDRWEDAYFFMHLFSGQFLVQCTFVCLMPVMVSQKRPDLSSKFKLFKAVLIILSMTITYVITADFRLIVYAFVISTIVADLIQSGYAVRKFQLNYKTLLIRAILLISFAITSSYLTKHFFLDLLVVEHGLLRLILAFGIFALMYLIIIRVFIFREIKNAVRFMKQYKGEE